MIKIRKTIEVDESLFAAVEYMAAKNKRSVKGEIEFLLECKIKESYKGNQLKMQ